MARDDYTIRTFKSIGIITLAYFLFSIVDTLQKYIGTLGYDVPAILLFTAAVSFTISALVILFLKGPKGMLPKKSAKLHALRVLFMVIGSYAIVSAVQYIPLAQFYAIVFSIPFLVAIGAIFVFGEQPGIWRWFAIIAGFIGVWIAANPDFSNLNAGILWSALAAFCVAASSLTVRKIGPGEFMPLFPLYIGGGIILLNGFLVDNFHLPQWEDSVWFLLCGLCIFFAIITLSLAFMIAPLAAVVAPFQYSQMIWGIVFGILVFNDYPDMRTLIGTAIIVASGLFLIWREYKEHRNRKRAAMHYTRV